MYETRYRPPGDKTCSCCENILTEQPGRPLRYRVLCDECRKKALGSGGVPDIIFHGSLGIRSFEAGWTA
jgi:hypothetical protein